MQIPETPQTVNELDLMKRLDDYANGTASWLADGSAVGEVAREACRTLHTNLLNLTKRLLAFVLDRVTAREMEMFTMHDQVHGRKVAHLMWHILKPERRDQLTPPEIGMLVVAAHLHDLGMGLTSGERAERLKPESDLWDKLEIQDELRESIQNLREQIGSDETSESVKKRASQQLFQAEEALLTQDTRERHATRERYEEILNLLSEFHEKDPVRIPPVAASLSFDGDSFRDKLIDVCMSHNEDADALVANDVKNLNRPRFPKDYPVGSCNANLHLVAAALRLADILDFDRERTPAVLFHYLLPTTLGTLENRSVLEWSKHLAISNWYIERDDIVFRGRSQSHIIHHAVVQFCSVIADELKSTHATFGEENWPFALPLTVKTDIHEDGYRYVPYKFELDDERVYSLLMGGAIYEDPLVAVRELVQNAVDACKLRDSLSQLYEEVAAPNTTNRIFIRYEEPTATCPYPKLSVRDTGTGMDRYTLERYFLQVGRSYYNSSDFNQYRVQLRKKNLDFAPVSEFGIGFLSSFLLADHVEVETAMWESPRGDTAKRILKIDGPTRLIRLDEQQNEGVGRFKGTKITLFLSSKLSQGDATQPASWEKVKKYLINVCQDLPYILNLEYVKDGKETKENIDPLPLTLFLPPHLEKIALRIPVDDKEFGIEGEIVLLNTLEAERTEKAMAGNASLVLLNESYDQLKLPSTLLRGGFNIGEIEDLADWDLRGNPMGARLRLAWHNTTNKRYLKPSLARDRLSDANHIHLRVFQLWLTYLLRNSDNLPKGQVFGLICYNDVAWPWLEEFNAWELYKLARQDWALQLRGKRVSEKALRLWETGKGAPLEYSFHSICIDLMNIVMPRVTQRQLDSNSVVHIQPPQQNWQPILENCRDFIRKPVGWGPFVAYEDKIDNFLLYGWNSFLNVKYKDRFASWSEKDVQNLGSVLGGLVYDPSRPTRLTPLESALFRKALELVGDLKVGTQTTSLTLNTLKFIEG